jgi:hypothetical protein
MTAQEIAQRVQLATRAHTLFEVGNDGFCA